MPENVFKCTKNCGQRRHRLKTQQRKTHSKYLQVIIKASRGERGCFVGRGGSHGWAGSGQQPLTSPSCPDSAPAYPWSFLRGCKTPIFNDTDLRRWKRWSRGQTHGSCEEDSPGHVRHRPGKELKWRPLPSGTQPSASVRGAGTRDELGGFARLLGGGGAPVWRLGSLKSLGFTSIYADGRLFPYSFAWNLRVLGFSFCCSAANSCCLSAQSCGCDLRPTRRGVDSFARFIVSGNDFFWRFYTRKCCFWMCKISFCVASYSRDSSGV